MSARPPQLLGAKVVGVEVVGAEVLVGAEVCVVQHLAQRRRSGLLPPSEKQRLKKSCMRPFLNALLNSEMQSEESLVAHLVVGAAVVVGRHSVVPCAQRLPLL
jgi:hypothetical protein